MGVVDLEAVEVTFTVQGLELPTTPRVQVRVVAMETVEVVPLLFTYSEVTSASLSDATGELPLRVSAGDDGVVSLTLPRPLSPGEAALITLQLSVSYPLDWDMTTAYQDDQLAHFVGFGLAPMSAEFPLDDLMSLTTHFDVRAPGVFPASLGERLARPALGEPGRWTYSLNDAVGILTYTLTPRPPVSLGDSAFEAFPPLSALDEGQEELSRMREALEEHGARFRMPYEGPHTLTTLSFNAGVAMGPPTMTLFPDDYWSINRSDVVMRRAFDMLIAHESAHQWFYRRIRMGQDSHAWLSEGFAEYSAARLIEEREGVGALGADWLFRSDRDLYQFTLSEGDELGPLASDANDQDGFVYLYVTYMRGMAVLRMLERRLENFDEVLAEYLRAHEGRFVVTDDFYEAVMAYGAPRADRPAADLEEFFRLWIYDTYRARLSVGARYLSDEESELEVMSDRGPLRDAFPVSLHAPEGEERLVYFDLAAGEVRRGGWQGVTLDPTLEYLGDVSLVIPEDLDLNGVVDGLDALEALARQDQSLGDYSNDRSWLSALDHDRDGLISDQDLMRVLGRFGQIN